MYVFNPSEVAAGIVTLYIYGGYTIWFAPCLREAENIWINVEICVEVWYKKFQCFNFVVNALYILV